MQYEEGHTSSSGRGKFPVTTHHTNSKTWLLQFQQNLVVNLDHVTSNTQTEEGHVTSSTQTGEGEASRFQLYTCGM